MDQRQERSKITRYVKVKKLEGTEPRENRENRELEKARILTEIDICHDNDSNTSRNGCRGHLEVNMRDDQMKT